VCSSLILAMLANPSSAPSVPLPFFIWSRPVSGPSLLIFDENMTHPVRVKSLNEVFTDAGSSFRGRNRSFPLTLPPNPAPFKPEFPPGSWNIVMNRAEMLRRCLSI